MGGVGAGLLEGPSLTTLSTLSPRSPSEGTIYRGCPQPGCPCPKPGLPRTADTPCAPRVGSGGQGREARERQPLPSPRSCNFGIMLGVRRPRPPPTPPPPADSPPSLGAPAPRPHPPSLGAPALRSPRPPSGGAVALGTSDPPLPDFGGLVPAGTGPWDSQRGLRRGAPATPASPGARPLGTRVAEQDRDQQTCDPSPAPRGWTSLGRPGCGQGGRSRPPPAPHLCAGPGVRGQPVLVPHPALPGWAAPSRLCPLRTLWLL